MSNQSTSSQTEIGLTFHHYFKTCFSSCVSLNHPDLKSPSIYLANIFVHLVCARRCSRHWEYNYEQATNYSGGRKIAKSVNEKVDGDVIKSDWRGYFV